MCNLWQLNAFASINAACGKFYRFLFNFNAFSDPHGKIWNGSTTCVLLLFTDRVFVKYINFPIHRRKRMYLKGQLRLSDLKVATSFSVLWTYVFRTNRSYQGIYSKWVVYKVNKISENLKAEKRCWFFLSLSFLPPQSSITIFTLLGMNNHSDTCIEIFTEWQ